MSELKLHGFELPPNQDEAKYFYTKCQERSVLIEMTLNFAKNLKTKKNQTKRLHSNKNK